MSSKKKIDPVNRRVVKQLIAARNDSQIDFCEKHGIKYGTFRNFMAGDHSLTDVNAEIARIIVDEWEPIPDSYLEDLRIQIEGAMCG